MATLPIFVPMNKDGDCTNWVAYPSERREGTFVLGQRHVTGKPQLLTMTARSPTACAYFKNFMTVRATALFEDDELTVHRLEVCVMRRGIEKYKAMYCMATGELDLKFNHWDK